MKNSLWYSRNCLNEKNLDYIENTLCEPNNINIRIMADKSGEDILLLTYKLDTYKVEIDRCCLLSLSKRNKALNPKYKEYYHLLDKFEGLDCWADLILWIVRNKNGKINDNMDI